MSRTRSIAHKTAIGAGWMVLWRMATRVLGLCSTLILARLLVPADFGVVAVATVFAGAFDALSLLGLQDVLIREKHVDPALYDTAFTVGALRGLANGALIALCAPVAASLFGEPRLTDIALILAAFSVLEGFESIRTADFRRNLDFNKEFLFFLLPRILSVITTVSAAFLLRSYWAMVIGLAVLRVARFVLSYIMRPYRPRFTLASWSRIAGFSFWTWATGIVCFVRDRSWTFILARLFDPFNVGLFMVGQEIATLPTNELLFPASRALFSGFAAARISGSNIGDAFLRTIAVLAIPLIPAAIGLSAVAAPIVSVALGPNWTGTIGVVEIIAPAGALSVFSSIGGVALMASGLVSLNFYLALFSAALGTISSFVCAKEFGLPGLAASVAGFAVLEGIAHVAVAMRSFGTPLATLPRSLGRPVIASALMTLALALSGYGWSRIDTLAHGVIAVMIGIATYASSLAALWWLAGRPDGAESYLIALARRSLARQGMPVANDGPAPQGSASELR
jgi:lipopolysaccharide exporter